MRSTLFEKDSLRFVPCRSQRGCDTRSAQRVNSDAPVVGIYDQTDFASADAKLCEAVCLHFSSRAEFVMTSTLPAFMDQRTDNRVQCVGDGEHDGDEVEHERECYIELDGAHHALGERDEVRQLRDFVVDERDIRGVHGDVAAHAAHCDADIGGLERGRVVYAVADHADLIARGLIGADVGELVLGQAVCVHLADVELRGNGCGGVLMVTREQHGLDLKRGELVDHVCTLLANRVGQGEEAREYAVHGGVGDGAALRELGVRRLGGLFGNGDVMFGEKLRVARKDDFFVNAGGDAAPGHHLEVFALFKRLARLLLAAVGDGLAERVLRIALRRGAEAVELVIGEGG